MPDRPLVEPPRPFEIRELEALRVGPDDVLIVRVPHEWGDIDGLLESVVDGLAEVGLEGRSIVFHGDVEFAVATRTEGDS